MRVPFRNMVDIGDSDTDIPCMKLVNAYGGHSIGVYDPQTGNREKVHRMILDGRISICGSSGLFWKSGAGSPGEGDH